MKNRVIEEIKKLAGEKIVRVETVEKVNRPPQIGVCFAEPSPGPNKVEVTPVIYINELVSKCESGEMTPEAAAQMVIDAVPKISDISFAPADFADYSKAKKHIIVRLINAEKNESLLKSLACVRVLDLAMIFSYVVQMEDGMGMINITREHLKNWNTDIAELRTTALENIEKDRPWSIRDLADMNMPGFFMPKGYMYVLTNRTGHFGASVIFYRNLLRDIFRQIGPFYLLPSSIHEWMLMPIIRHTDPEELKNIVCSINRDVLEVDDYLSDSVYYFNGDSLEIKN